MKNKIAQHILTILFFTAVLYALSGYLYLYATDRHKSAVDWNDDHADTGYIIQWKGMKFNTKYHAYDPFILQEHALDVLEYKESPPDDTENYWFPQNVQIDTKKNELQLVMRRYGPKWEGQPVWSCAEAVLEENLYYGKYSVTVISYGSQASDGQPEDPDPWGSLFDDQNTVLGIFTYDKNPDWDGENTFREIDIIEIFGKVHSASEQIGNAQFVVQPYYGTPENYSRITLPKPERNLLTFEMDWKKDSIDYYVRDGNKVVARYSYTNTDYIPEPSKTMRLHINVWVFGGPWDAKPKRVGITDIKIERY
ncbi:MAG: family 16 glycosylhydrolase [Spirochaetota bacterium]|nr:MAG: family 16 glycosylhydrolase [Spirochaetota bacterium]